MYCNLDDLKKKIDERKLIELTDDTGTGVIDQAKVDEAIKAADALIDSYVSIKYSVPLVPTPHLIIDLSAQIAIYKLHAYRSIESTVWKEALDSSIKILLQISKGNITLAGSTPTPSTVTAPTSVATSAANTRIFSRDTLKDY